MRDRYASPQALEAAIRAKSNEVARASGMSPSDLVTAFHFQRLLARVFHEENNGWMLKGGQCLMLRFPRQARLSRDADLFRPEVSDVTEAVEALEKALATDLDDYFNFIVQQVTPEGSSAQVKVGLRIGAVQKTPLNVDLVARRTPTGEPMVVKLKPIIPLEWPDTWPEAHLYPIQDHVADKIAAMYERHLRVGRGAVPSTRFRDLADILLVSQQMPIDGQAVQTALASEVARRNALGAVELTLPEAFEVPDQASWQRGYPREASAVPGLRGCRTLADAAKAAQPFVNPLLAPTNPGIWNPGSAKWGSL